MPYKKLQKLRQSIDNLDAALIHILAERFRCTEQIGVLKAEHNINSFDSERANQQKERLCLLAKQSGLNENFAEKILKFISQEVINNHNLIKTQINK